MVESLEQLPVLQLDDRDQEDQHHESAQEQRYDRVAAAPCIMDLVIPHIGHDQWMTGQNCQTAKCPRSMPSMAMAEKMAKR